MSQIYLILSNIQVKQQEKKVEVHPFYGILMKWRSVILKKLHESENLREFHFDLFFQQLDNFIEDGLLNLLDRYPSKNYFQREGYTIVMDESQQNYNLATILRSDISNTTVQHDQNVANEFYKQIMHMKEHLKVTEPSRFHLQRLSSSGMYSRRILIAVSGFTSKDEDKFLKWQGLRELYPNTEIYALQYDCKSCTDLYDFVTGIINPTSSFTGILSFALQMVTRAIQNNPYKQASVQANLTGFYLAHFLHEATMFPNCSISLLGYSLGTQVIFECLEEYSKLCRAFGKSSIIDSVAVMGSVVNAEKANNPEIIEVVGNRLVNFYSENDSILRYVLRLTELFSQPIGLGPIKSISSEHKRKVESIDFTKQIDGHPAYMDSYSSLLHQAGFLQEFYQ